MVFVSANFHIVEVMPNTTDDKNLEYVVIQNTSSGTQSLSWFILSDKQKDFIFSSLHSLAAWEKKQFFRPETKLILNNTNERLTLKNPARDVISEVEYSSSIKWTALRFPDLESQEEVIEDDDRGKDMEAEDFSHEAESQEEGKLQVLFDLQRPSYITQSGASSVYVCDTSKETCKVNFNLEKSFTSSFKKGDYFCRIDFWGTWTGEIEKCNPNTVEFPEGESPVVFRIFSRKDESLEAIREIQIINDSSLSSWDVTNSHSSISILYPRVTVQSGLNGDGRYFYCQKLECKINLEYKKRHKNERCLWKFWEGEKSHPTTDERCNPWYVSYGPWTYELKLRVYEKGNRSNKKVFRFYVYNEPEQFLVKEEKEQERVVWKKGEEKRDVPLKRSTETHWLKIPEQKIVAEEARKEEIPSEKTANIDIVLQWKLSKNKSLSGNILDCRGELRCYVNFTSSWEELSENIDVIWKQNGDIFSQKQNPSGVWIEWEGKHEISLELFDGEKMLQQKFFYIRILQAAENVILQKEKQERSWEDVKEGIEKEKKYTATMNFLPLKYDGLRISGKYLPSTSIKIFHGDKLLRELRTETSWKYRFVTKNILPWEHAFTLQWSNEVLQEKKYVLWAEKRAYWFTSKKPWKKSWKSSSTNIKTPQLVMQAQASDMQPNKNAAPELRLEEKIAAYFFLALALLLALGHMLFCQIDSAYKSSKLLSHSLRFSVKQQVNLLLG